MMTDTDNTAGYGVKVRPNAMCFWQVDNAGITIWLDVRCGGKGVELKGRSIAAATIVFRNSIEGENPFTATKEFCKVMCNDPVLPERPVYGGNNWYYSYGMSSHEKIINDSKFISELSKGNENPPFFVIDDGWQENYTAGYNAGPWVKGNERFPDMKRLADEIKKENVRPGIWIRLLWNHDKNLSESFRLQRQKTFLDPSIPEVLEQVKADVKRMSDWGYELIKHDFSTWDIFGKWGFEMGADITDGDWAFSDTTKTSAEIVKNLYKTIYESRGNALILGCNCIGHLGAGMMHIYRTGDDTSGIEWERIRKMGVNTLAFRMPQHNSFYAVDADCSPITRQLPWEYSKQWLKVLSLSGTPLFVSADSEILNESQKSDLINALKSSSCQTEIAEPLDWLYTTCPSKWKVNGDTIEFHWYEKGGISKFNV